MLFWPKFLTIAHGVASSVHVFLPLYFFHLLHFSYYRIAILLAIALTTRTIACGFWTAWVDQRDIQLHGVLTSLLTGLGAASLVLLLSVPPDTWLSWPAAILCMVLDGWFFQPLGCLIDGIIIKILGDYKLLYESERRWGKISLGITALGIGCFLDDDYDFDTLMGTVLVGCVALFLLSLSTTVQPADPLSLGLQTDEQSMETSPLLAKPPLLSQYYIDENRFDHHQRNHQQSQSHMTYNTNHESHPYSLTSYSTTTNAFNNTENLRSSFDTVTAMTSSYSSYQPYKPYSLFGDHLSHISEEDVNMLQQIPSTPPRASSIISTNTNSLNYLLDNSTYQFTPITYCLPSSPSLSPPTPSSSGPFTSFCYSSPPPPPPSSSIPTSSSSYIIDSTYYGDTPDTMDCSSFLDSTFMSMSLALLPFPPGDIPMVVLITIFPRFQPLSFYRHQSYQQQQVLEQQEIQSNSLAQIQEVDSYQEDDKMDDTKEEWSYLLIMSSCFLLGLAYTPLILWSPLIYYDYFGLPMHSVGMMILVGCLSDVMATGSISVILEKFSFRWCIIVLHAILMICIFIYAWMPSGQVQYWWSLMCLFVLHIISSSSIQMLWLMASYQVDLLYLTNCQDRMMLRGKMSALYSSFGPAFGSLVLGWLVTMGWSFYMIYLFTFMLIPISAFLALGWY
ncbi:uncharacterized protein BX664DRAFT_326564 [Halteromyces radiatus]|uniref:uncharacterized protein n=1 Tax=Halteromyces radiatus TaxID=101107 RepID=UPI00221FD5D1|nr:uncharacterized protein BX664DRAFT_326564 [Halteromyces radiatus]KAI8097502.1 hypothetical protein BX664DRAFT_326564 [Halteromyces radiatus]